MVVNSGKSQKVFTYIAALNLANVTANSFLDTDLAATEGLGFQLDDFVAVACVSVRGSGDSSRNLIFSAFVKPSTITTNPIICIRAHNPTGTDINPNSYTFKFFVVKF